MKTAVLYHADCPDGWCAAWVAYNALKVKEKLVAELVPVRRGTPPPYLAGFARVFILDFCYSADVLVELTSGGSRPVIVLDHHRSAADDVLAGRTGKQSGSWAAGSASAIFDMDRSGAGMTWDYFYPDTPRPDIVNYVEDRDLGRWMLPRSRAVNAFLKAQPRGLGAWDDIYQFLSLGDMASGGEGALLQMNAYIRAASGHSYWCQMGGREFPIVNVTYESCSDVVEYLLDQQPEADMAGYFFHSGSGLWTYGFRGQEGVDVAEFAEQFGGGGHERSAGCRSPEILHERIDR